MNQLLYMFAGSVCTLLIGCGSGGGAPADEKAVDPTAPAITQPSQPGGAIPVQLTYYSLSKTVYPVNGFPATHGYTATGSCVVYNSQTYCWDDGIKMIDFTLNNFRYGPFTYDYWDHQAPPMQGSQLAPCIGGCVSDPLTAPMIVSQNVEASLTLAKINLVFSSGQAKAVTCTLTNADLDCVDFSIDLTQVPF